METGKGEFVLLFPHQCNLFELDTDKSSFRTYTVFTSTFLTNCVAIRMTGIFSTTEQYLQEMEIRTRINWNEFIHGRGWGL